jgi:hypothetical protein
MEKSCCGGKPATPENSFREKLAQYRPLVVITAAALFAATALAAGGAVPFMRGAMGMFFLLLAAPKLFDWRGFAAGFAGYDVLARRSRTYALAYPFIEFALAGLYLSGFLPVFTALATLMLMILGNAGVVRVIRSGAKLKCVCAGSGFNLPVGRVTFAENTVMALMALMSLLHGPGF